MRGQAIVAGARDLLIFIVKAILFPLTWMWAWKLAKKHSDADPGATRKVAVAIIVGLIAAPGIGYLIYDFQDGARDGMYATLEGRLASTYGASAYGDQDATAGAAVTVVGILSKALGEAQVELDNATAALDAAETSEEADAALPAFEAAVAKLVDLRKNLDLARLTLDQSGAWRDRLVEEKEFFESIHDEILAHDDAGLLDAAAKRASIEADSDNDVATALLDAEAARDKAAQKVVEATAVVETYRLLQEGRGLSEDESAAFSQAQDDLSALVSARSDAVQAVQAALANAQNSGIELPVPKAVYENGRAFTGTQYWLGIKDEADHAMGQWLVYLLFPGLIGVFYAPLFFALGSIMARAWDPSESVGFKVYPGASLGLFLFLGAFGWPSLLFSAWGFWDLDVRSKEGQISL